MVVACWGCGGGGSGDVGDDSTIVPTRDGLIGEWLLNGSLDDTSGNGNDGTHSTTITAATDRFGAVGKAIYFGGGENSKITDIPVTTSADAYTTVSLWLKADDPLNNGMPFSWNSVYDLYFYENYFGFNTFAGEITGIDITSDNRFDQWVHVAAIFINAMPSAGNVSLFINNVKETLTSSGAAFSSSVSDTVILSDANGTQFIGAIDDLRIYDRALTADEVYDLYHEGNYGL